MIKRKRPQGESREKYKAKRHKYKRAQERSKNWSFVQGVLTGKIESDTQGALWIDDTSLDDTSSSEGTLVGDPVAVETKWPHGEKYPVARNQWLQSVLR